MAAPCETQHLLHAENDAHIGELHSGDARSIESAAGAQTRLRFREGLRLSLSLSAICFVFGGICVLLRRSQTSGSSESFALRKAEEKLVSLQALDASQRFQCKDTAHWANGWSGCAYDKQYGKNSSLCAATPGAGWPSTRGWTCKQYENMGWCKDGKPLAAFAMGERLQFPEENCCACGGGDIQSQCKVDTGKSCDGGTLPCAAWLGNTRCYKSSCLCMPGYCVGEAGTCHLVESSLNVELQPTCDRITNKACGGASRTPISIKRGQATCDDALRKAVCNPGLCSDPQSFCFKGMGLVKADVHAVNIERPEFPGQQGQVKTAISFSGGGSRAAATAIGILRALHYQGLIPKLDALSSVSGGSWASSIFMFAKEDLGTLLGKPTEPSKLTMAELDRVQATALAVFTNSTTRISEALLNAGVPNERMWVEATSTAFLKPFGLGDLTNFMAADEDQVARIKARNPQYADSTFQVPAPGRPKVFVMSGSALAPDQYEMSNTNTVSLQMSPDFSGEPFQPDNAPNSFKASFLLNLPELHDIMQGGGLIETFAFGGPAPVPKEQDGGSPVELQAPITPFSLARAVGISSSAFGGFLSQIGQLGEDFDPQTSLWPVTNKEHNESQSAMTFQLGDGACTDNTGLLAMLQRGASKIVMVDAAQKGMDTSVDWCTVPASHPGLGSAIDNSFANKFGYEPSKGSDFVVAVRNNQVFAKSEFQPILCRFLQKKKAGKPLILRRTLTVQRNDWWGIKGGNKVDMLFVMLDTVEDFNNALPADTKQKIALGPAGGLYPFPGFATILQNAGELTAYTNRQLNLLAAQTEYMANTASVELAELLA